MVANWMASVYHRVNILDKDFRDVGVGVVAEARSTGAASKGYATFAVVFGARARA